MWVCRCSTYITRYLQVLTAKVFTLIEPFPFPPLLRPEINAPSPLKMTPRLETSWLISNFPSCYKSCCFLPFIFSPVSTSHCPHPVHPSAMFDRYPRYSRWSTGLEWLKPGVFSKAPKRRWKASHLRAAPGPTTVSTLVSCRELQSGLMTPNLRSQVQCLFELKMTSCLDWLSTEFTILYSPLYGKWHGEEILNMFKLWISSYLITCTCLVKGPLHPFHTWSPVNFS